MELEFERCYRAVDSRDQRFDGWFFTAVTSTGIYCQPSCPAITPKRANVRFYPRPPPPSGPASGPAGAAGRTPRPGSPEWDVRADTVGRAMRLIARRRRRPGGRARPRLAARLHRAPPAPDAHRGARRRPAGAGPGAACPDRPDPGRDDRPRPRRDRVRGRFRQRAAVQRHDPGGVRRPAVDAPPAGDTARRKPASINLRLAYRPPLHADALLEFLADRAIPGVEEVATAPTAARCACHTATRRWP